MFMADITQADLTILGDLMQAGKVKPVIDRTYPLRERGQENILALLN
jgi:NADPH:quinone reductase-like Zn-dependent oxidoreductase